MKIHEIKEMKTEEIIQRIKDEEQNLVDLNPGEVDRLLKEMNENGYYYSLVYRGAEQRQIEDIIGLNLVERFFFHLRKLLDTDDIENLRKLVHSSQRLSDLLIRFSREAGKPDFEAGGIVIRLPASQA